MTEDRIDYETAVTLLQGTKPMACCPHDGEPLICTLEFNGAEFYCVTCERTYGFLSPTPKPWTAELQARHDELEVVYQAACDERDFERYGERCDRTYVYPPVTSEADHERCEIRWDDRGHGRPFLDGRWVTLYIRDAFMAEWTAFVEANEA